MKTPSVKSVRCAIYTRVSTEQGLDQEFNSLDAQYDAASAYIRSQAHAGWTTRVRQDQAELRVNIRLMFHAMVTRLHSPRTLSSPRSRNWRNPRTDLMMPNTGSGICLRRE